MESSCQNIELTRTPVRNTAGGLGFAVVAVSVIVLLAGTKTTFAQVEAPTPNDWVYSASPPEEVLGNKEDAEEPTVKDLAERLRKAEDRLIELEKPAEDKGETESRPKAWYEKIEIGGYAQFRYNEILDMEPGSAPAHHVQDSSVGEDENFLIRRARLNFSGFVSDRIFVYFQPDFASNVPDSPDRNLFGQSRGCYADLYFDDALEYRVRVGQSKVPYGWENMQSSRNRLPLDRNDALNSAVENERDVGAFFYWTPVPAQEFFERLDEEGLKPSGDFGVFALGVYNGQGGSLREQNDNLHIVSRLTLPVTFENGQMMEVGLQGYTGNYTVLSSPISPLGVGGTIRPLGTLETGNESGIRDDRIAATFVYYPQPFGIQSEWTVGRGPSLNDAQTAVVDRALRGGYFMLIYREQTESWGEFWPFLRWSTYEGGYKTERNSPYAEIDEWELGLEWQINDNLEIVTMYSINDRTNTEAMSSRNTLSYEQFEGELLRFQLQVRF